MSHDNFDEYSGFVKKNVDEQFPTYRQTLLHVFLDSCYQQTITWIQGRRNEFEGGSIALSKH